MKRPLAVLALAAALGAAPDDPIARVRAWRAQHEAQILREAIESMAALLTMR